MFLRFQFFSTVFIWYKLHFSPTHASNITGFNDHKQMLTTHSLFEGTQIKSIFCKTNSDCVTESIQYLKKQHLFFSLGECGVLTAAKKKRMFYVVLEANAKIKHRSIFQHNFSLGKKKQTIFIAFGIHFYNKSILVHSFY